MDNLTFVPVNWNDTFSLLSSTWKETNLQQFYSPVSWYFKADPLVSALAIVAFFSFYTWIMGTVTRNYSQVDKLWSIIPPLYAWHFAFFSHFEPRTTLMALLVTAWGARLTYNYWRKGGYEWSAEDYRWAIVKKSMHPIFWELLNITFISVYQQVLLFLIVLPSYVAYKANGTVPFNFIDYIGIGLFLVFLIGETVADEQQWVFQNKKHALSKSNAQRTGDYSRGFLTRGLFSFSRHPNFFCEMSIWWSLYVFSIAVTGEYLHWSVVGAVLLTLLFQGSTNLTEKITKQKYPEYGLYQRSTSRLIPWFPGKIPQKKRK